jgi:hypothetical protein
MVVLPAPMEPMEDDGDEDDELAPQPAPISATETADAASSLCVYRIS